MAIEKKLIHFGKLADFEAQLTAGNILDRSIVFIQDAKKIWTHGTYYDCSEGTAEGDELWYVDDTNGKLITDYDTEVLAELQAIRVRTNSISAYNGNEYATGEQGQVLTADGNGNMQWSDLPENVYITDFTVQNLLDLYGGHIEELHINGQALMSAIYDRKNILVHYEGDTVGGYDILLGEVSGSEMYFSVYSHFGFVFFCEAVEDIITSIHFGDLTGEKVERTQTGDLTHIAVANALQTADGYTYAVPDSATGDEDDVLLSRSTVKTINGESIYGGGDITIEGGSLTESDIAAMGFTKNTGTYSKPSGGIPKSDLASAVQTSLGKADTALQSYTEKYQGTVTGVKMNGASKGTSGVVDLGNVVTSVKINGSTKTPTNGVVDLGTISGGGSSGGSGAYSEVNHGTSDTTFILTPNTFHIWDEVANLTLTLGSETSGVANEFLFQFNSGSNATTLTMSDDIKWTEELVIEANRIYQISILKGLASVLSWENTTDTQLISFTVDGVLYNAEDGMTWEVWCESPYNTGGFSVSFPNVQDKNGNYVYSDTNGSYVYFNNAIYINSYTTVYGPAGGE